MKKSRQRFGGSVALLPERLTGKAMSWFITHIRQWEKRPLAQRKREAIGIMVGLLGMLGVNVYLTLHRNSDEAKPKKTSVEQLYEGARQRWHSMPQNRPR